ncbi:nucleoside monophosphate kinase [Patescibacteria group bacterium]|nr:nucleoside monophosphate kinase [Patescibacteria group bacterium]
MQPQTFIFFGIIGSGKGTQVDLLREYLKDKNIVSDILYTSTGAEFRKVIESGSYTGQIIKETLEKGFLQPNFITTSLFTNILISGMKDEICLIADGYPRTIAQSESFEAMMKFYKRKNIKIIYIELSKEEAMKRNLLRGRTDDTKEGIEQRFNEYVNNVIPAMNYFKDKVGYSIYTINGEQTIEKVHKEIIKTLGF